MHCTQVNNKNGMKDKLESVDGAKWRDKKNCEPTICTEVLHLERQLVVRLTFLLSLDR